MRNKGTTTFALWRALPATQFSNRSIQIPTELYKKEERDKFIFKRKYLSRKLCFIRIPRASDLMRDAKRRQNQIDFVRTSIYPLQRFRSPIRSFCLKGGKGARSSIYDFSPLISTKINGRKYAALTVKLLTGRSCPPFGAAKGGTPILEHIQVRG